LEKVCKGLKLVAKLFSQPFVLMPLIYLLLSGAFPPDYSGIISFSSIKKLNMTIFGLSLAGSLSGIAYYFFFLWLLPKIKNTPLWKLYIWSNLANLVLLLNVTVFYPTLPLWVQYASVVVQSLIQNLTSDLKFIPLVALVSKHLPEGYESTGVVVIIALSNFSGIAAVT
jgi:hypothetical protein